MSMTARVATVAPAKNRYHKLSMRCHLGRLISLRRGAVGLGQGLDFCCASRAIGLAMQSHMPARLMA